jgi:hypothetical protein
MPAIGTCPPKHLHAYGSMVVQSILFDRSRVSRPEAVAWLRAHGYRAVIDAKPKHWRARQIDPGCFRAGSFRTILWSLAIEAVVGKLKV